LEAFFELQLFVFVRPDCCEVALSEWNPLLFTMFMWFIAF
jgi:hypothetical protein